MERASFERILTSVEQALDRGGRVDLARLGFWRAVAAAKRDRALIDAYADRIAAIDRAAFLRATPLALPARVGIVLLAGGTVAGFSVLAIAANLGPPLRELALVAGAGALIGATHGLAHWIVGSAFGMRFTHWFFAPPKRPQPGLKTDYATYLRASPRARAWMHASGAIVTKLVPFAVLPYAVGIGAETWAVAALLALGVLQLITDALFSVRASDWKKFRREMRVARST